ncbi:MAG: hypothetical protein WA252_01065 [Candidatus Sulfotelmatobacter sp.]
MPAELLEKPVEAEETSREIPKATSAQRPGLAAGEAAESNRSLWRKVFEGHEEFLGCTPD